MVLLRRQPTHRGPSLEGPVDRFVDTLTPALMDLASSELGDDVLPLRTDVVTEAFQLCCAFIDVDGLHTDSEIEALIATFSRHFEGRLDLADVATVRQAGVVRGKKRFLAAPSKLLELLVAADQRDGTELAWRYYEMAMEIGHRVCALDDHTSHTELEALGRFRQIVLATLRAAGVGRGEARADGTAPSHDGDEEEHDEAEDEAEDEEGYDEDEELPEARSLEEVLAELEGLVGLDAVKEEVERLADLLYIERLRAERELAIAKRSLHLVFTGNPGTGKTTVARLIAEIYRALGALPKGHLVETDRSGLVAGFVGQTAERTAERFEEARGGVLLIDEAYALARSEDGRDFGREAIDTLVKLMEDHRHDTALIVAGYPKEMADFIGSNPGLESRFPKTIHFPDYSDDELVAVFEIFCAKHSYKPDSRCIAALRSYLEAETRDKGFGNARVVRNVFEEAVARQASRLRKLKKEPTDTQLCRLTGRDIPEPGAR